METYGVDFDAVANKGMIELRNSLRDNYIPAFQRGVEFARNELKKAIAKRDALESMRANLDTLCSSIRFICQKMEEPIPEIGQSIFDIMLYKEEKCQATRESREKILKNGGELLSPACGAAAELKVLFDDAITRIQNSVSTWTNYLNDTDAALRFWQSSLEMIAWRPIFDNCEDKFKVKVSREATRWYAGYIEQAKSFLRIVKMSALEAMRSNETEESVKDLLGLAECSFKYLRSFKNVASDYGHEVALNADKAAKADSDRYKTESGR